MMKKEHAFMQRAREKVNNRAYIREVDDTWSAAVDYGYDIPKAQPYRHDGEMSLRQKLNVLAADLRALKSKHERLEDIHNNVIKYHNDKNEQIVATLKEGAASVVMFQKMHETKSIDHDTLTVLIDLYRETVANFGVIFDCSFDQLVENKNGTVG